MKKKIRHTFYKFFSIVLSSASQPVEPDTTGRLLFKQNDIFSKADLGFVNSIPISAVDKSIFLNHF